MQVQLTDFDRDQLKRLNALVEERRKTYAFASLKIVLVKYPNQPDWKNSMTLVHFNHKDQSPEKDETFHYPNCVLAKRSLKVDQLTYLVGEMLTSGRFILGDLYPFHAEWHVSPILMYDYQSSD